MSHLPSREEIQREGWDTPAAEYLNEQLNQIELERDLLVMSLRECLGVVTSDYERRDGTFGDAHGVVARARNALAKAEGK